jgi:enolase-phosphatase E1
MTARESTRLCFRGEHLLLDIEGTTSPLAIVQTVLFPYVREHVADFVRRHWETSDLERVRVALLDSATPSSSESFPNPTSFVAEINRLMDLDAKVSPLKELQGWIWKEGFEAGKLLAEVFDDVPEAIQGWNQAGLRVSIYSSGSVLAQQLFFRHLAGPVRDLTPWLHQFFDTMVGPKQESQSYSRIVAALQTQPTAVLFLSDVLAELDAARLAGLRTALVVRPGNPGATAAIDTAGINGHPVVRHFAEIDARLAEVLPALR